MTPKQYLNQYRTASRAIRLARLQVEKAEHEASGIRAILYSDMPKSHNVEHDLSDAMIRIEELAHEYNDVVKVNTRIIADVGATIQEVSDPIWREILWLRYIECMKWEDIAVEIHMTDRWMFTLHGRALRDVARILSARQQ